MGGVIAYFLATSDDVTSDANQPNENTGLTNREVTTIKNSWKVMKKDSATTGKELFIQLFTDHPNYQKFFKSFSEVPLEELFESGKFQAHAVTVMYALTSFVDNLDSPEVLKELIHRTARNHNFRGVSANQFKDFTKLVIGAIEIKSKHKLDEITTNAWTKLITVLNNTFEEGIKLAKQETI